MKEGDRGDGGRKEEKKEKEKEGEKEEKKFLHTDGRANKR